MRFRPELWLPEPLLAQEKSARGADRSLGLAPGLRLRAPQGRRGERPCPRHVGLGRGCPSWRRTRWHRAGAAQIGGRWRDPALSWRSGAINALLLSGKPPAGLPFQRASPAAAPAPAPRSCGRRAGLHPSSPCRTHCLCRAPAASGSSAPERSLDPSWEDGKLCRGGLECQSVLSQATRGGMARGQAAPEPVPRPGLRTGSATQWLVCGRCNRQALRTMRAGGEPGLHRPPRELTDTFTSPSCRSWLSREISVFR